MTLIEASRRLDDSSLSRELRYLASRETHALAQLLCHLAEYDRRRLCAKDGSESLFAHCVRALGYDEFDAYRRIRAARVLQRYPKSLPYLEKGKVGLSALVALAPVLTPENHEEWLRVCAGKSKREIEGAIAARYPYDPRQDVLRRLPDRAYAVLPEAREISSGDETTVTSTGGEREDRAAAAGLSAVEATILPRNQSMRVVALERIRVGFDAAADLMGLIERARQLLRHKFPEGRLEDIVREALEALLDRKDAGRRLERRGVSDAPEGDGGGRLAEPRLINAWRSGRYIPAKVKAAVWRRDDGRCAWRFDDGVVCGSRDFLEYDHIVPFARGGRSDNPRNIRLLCRLHNGLAAERAGLPRPGSRDEGADSVSGGG